MLEERWSRQWSHRGDRLVAVVESCVPSVIHWAEWRGGEGTGNSGLGGRETRATENHFANLRDRSSLGWVELEDSSQESIEFQGDWKNGSQEIGILHERTECAVLEGGSLPWIAPTS